ncbi:MAG: response regulator transcription factor [Dehalococcoidales bacterium]|nr:response regulator transcription factor [Dehalococcoidales bacterium]
MTILIIEDDKEITEVIRLALEIRWPEAKLVTTHLGNEGVRLTESEKPDVVLLDLGLPDTSGYDVLKEIRTFTNVPVLILTVRGEEADIIRGLEWGADDYMIKPFRQMELLARIRALVRRGAPALSGKTIVCGELSFNPETRQTFFRQEEIELTNTEGIILYELMKNTGQVVPHSRLAEVVWGGELPTSTESLRVYIRRLREKIETDPQNPRIIVTKSGIGYSLNEPV